MEYALSFVLGVQEVDKILVGVNSVHQVEEVIQAAQRFKGVKGHFIDDINLLNPSLWKV